MTTEVGERLRDVGLEWERIEVGSPWRIDSGRRRVSAVRVRASETR